VTGIEPALSAWESNRSGSLTGLTWATDAPLVTVRGPVTPGLMARQWPGARQLFGVGLERASALTAASGLSSPFGRVGEVRAEPARPQDAAAPSGCQRRVSRAPPWLKRIAALCAVGGTAGMSDMSSSFFGLLLRLSASLSPSRRHVFDLRVSHRLGLVERYSYARARLSR
jgi:hypothetical protein